MIRYLTLEEALELHRLALEQSGGLDGIRDFGGLESALAQPRMTFGGQDLYPSLAEKAVPSEHGRGGPLDTARRPAWQLR